MRELAESSHSASAASYGVSDNAIRKWVRQYERERAAERGGLAASDNETPELAA